MSLPVNVASLTTTCSVMMLSSQTVTAQDHPSSENRTRHRRTLPAEPAPASSPAPPPSLTQRERRSSGSQTLITNDEAQAAAQEAVINALTEADSATPVPTTEQDYQDYLDLRKLKRSTDGIHEGPSPSPLWALLALLPLAALLAVAYVCCCRRKAKWFRACAGGTGATPAAAIDAGSSSPASSSAPLISGDA